MDRPTRDVDLFTSHDDAAIFQQGVMKAREALVRSGFRIEEDQSVSSTFQRFEVSKNGVQVQIEMGPDWMSEPPVWRDSVGYVLSEKDAVSSKLDAAYGRGMPRDFIDIDKIRSSGKYSDADLISMLEDRDPGFNMAMFSDCLQIGIDIEDNEYRSYLSDDETQSMKSRLKDWRSEVDKMISGSSNPIFGAS
jgi:hypothetical protein